MKKSVLVTLKSIQSDDRNKNETELITEAEFETLKGGGFRISYAESDATGFDGSTTEVRCYGDKIASICRSGTASSNLVMEKDKKQHCHYGTPYGELMVGIYTHAIVNGLTEDGGDLYMKYTVDINSSFVSDNEILLHVTPSPKRKRISE